MPNHTIEVGNTGNLLGYSIIELIILLLLLGIYADLLMTEFLELIDEALDPGF